MIALCVFISTKIRHAVTTKALCLGLPPITDMHNPVQTGDITIGMLSKETRESVRLNRFTIWSRNWIKV